MYRYIYLYSYFSQPGAPKVGQGAPALLKFSYDCNHLESNVIQIKFLLKSTCI